MREVIANDTELVGHGTRAHIHAERFLGEILGADEDTRTRDVATPSRTIDEQAYFSRRTQIDDIDECQEATRGAPNRSHA